MKISDFMELIECPFKIISDGEFSVLEQCTRVRYSDAMTYIENSMYLHTLDNANISCVICLPEILPLVPSHIKGRVITGNPKTLFYNIHNYLAKHKEKRPSIIDPTAIISPLAYISPYNVVIGENVEIQAFVVINEGCVIEKNVRICVGAILGGQSFTAVHNSVDKEFLACDGGSVVIEEGVEICSYAHIACGTLEKDITRLGAYTKIDALVHIGHGAIIGRQTLIAASALVSGNCNVGSHVWIGVNATISNRITIGDYARVSLGAVVTKDVPAGATVSGNFAIDHQRFLQNLKSSAQ